MKDLACSPPGLYGAEQVVETPYIEDMALPQDSQRPEIEPESNVIALTPEHIGALCARDWDDFTNYAMRRLMGSYKISPEDLVAGAVERVLQRVMRPVDPNQAYTPVFTSEEDMGRKYMFRSINNCLTSMARRRWFTLEQPDSGMYSVWNTMAAPDSNLTEVPELTELVKGLRNSGLDADMLQAFVMHHAFQMEYREIAEEQGVPLGTVRSRISRALKHCKQLVADGTLQPGGFFDTPDVQ